MQRRQLLRGIAASATLQALLGGNAAAAGLKAIGQSEAFDYALLKGRARALAAKAYQAPRSTLPKAIDSLDWDRHQAIRFRPDHALWGDDELRFRAQFFHLGLFFKSPVRIHELVDGRARELAYDAEMFD
ncbi:MAG: glucan biosynthesis protein, partial [Methylibium sp.]|nr:glucan biosynthesis protein [Methylibium sp.]